MKNIALRADSLSASIGNAQILHGITAHFAAARWTSVVPEDPIVVVAAGRSRFRVDDLIDLVALVRRSGP